MKSKLLLLILICISLPITAQTVDFLIGSWSGKLSLGQSSLTIVFNFEQSADSIMSTLDVPTQGAKGIAVTADHISTDSIALSIPSIGANYRGVFKDNRFEGVFEQFGHSFPLLLEKGVKEVVRPQNPLPPYPYATEEVTFKNEQAGATLAATLTYPVGYVEGQPAPVVLFVTGSGQQNRDEELMDHKPFLVISDYLARRGIASLRYDDRGFGASTGGDVVGATTEDFMLDAAAGIDFLRGLGKFGRIGCIGHSEGASVAFMLAARGDVDFIVSMAGIGMKGDTVLTAQYNRIMELSGMPSSFTVKDYRDMLATQPAVKWLQWFIDYDPSADISNARCPVFALNGANDSQVISSQNLRSIEQLLPTSGKNKIKEYPSLNHLFQHSATGLPTEYIEIEETISPEVLSDIADWIESVAR